MEEIRTKIAELKHTGATLDAQLKTRYQTFGEQIYPYEKLSDDPLLEETRDLVEQKRAAAASLEEEISRIRQATSASEIAKEEIAKIEQRLASIEFEKNSLYSRIGVISYEEYAAGEIGEEFSLLFTSITHQNAELSRVQKDLKENELRYVAASFFEKMSLRMKRNKLKAELEKMDGAREDLFKNSGKQICNSELISRVKSKNAVSISRDFSRLDQERDRMYALLESRKFEYNQNRDLLSHAGVEGDVNKRVKELEKQADRARRELGDAYSELGTRASVDEACQGKADVEDGLKPVISEIAQLTEERRLVQQQLDIFDSRLKIKELESTIDVDHQKELRLKSQVKALNEQLDDLKLRISGNRKQIAALKKLIQDAEPRDDEPDGE